jgi:pyruvate dehydrogenase E2 component (dihydrolipoamide acetyltransferase)
MEDVQAYAERMKSAAVSAPPSETPVSATVATSQSNGATRTAPTVEQKALPSTPATAEERQPLTGLRRRIAERMERSWRTIPHASAFDEVDGTELMALRQALKPIAEQRGVRLTYMPFLVKLLIPALKEFPIFNASLDEEKHEIVYKRSYHIGIATDAPEGLLVPVLRDADKLTLIEVAKQLEHLIEAAQKRTLTMAEAGGSTFTLNNVGSFGGSSGTPIINYPESAILLVGRMQEQAIVQNGAVIVRPMMPLVMSFDHRLIDGALAGKFLAKFKELVEHPQQLMLDML